MIAVEFTDPATHEPRADVPGAVAAYAAQQGVLVLTAGTYGNVVRFLPSLAITDAQLLDAVGVIDDALADALIAPDDRSAAGSVELAVLERSGEIESRHLGAAVLLDADGSILDSLGDPAALIYPRSAVKPLQATAVLGTGLRARGRGARARRREPRRHPGARRPSSSGCWPRPGWTRAPCSARSTGRSTAPPVTPRAGAAPHHHELLGQARGVPGRVGARRLDAPPTTWTPRTRCSAPWPTTIADYAGEAVAHWGIDGCNAPTPVISLAGLARSFGRLAASDSPLPAAILAHPWAIDGPGRENAVAIAETGRDRQGRRRGRAGAGDAPPGRPSR